MSTPAEVIEQIIDGSLPLESLAVFGTEEVKLPGLVLPCEGAIDIWHRLRAQVDRLGHWPLLVDEQLDILVEEIMGKYSYIGGPQAIIDRGQALDVEAWLKARKEFFMSFGPPDDDSVLNIEWSDTEYYLPKNTFGIDREPAPGGMTYDEFTDTYIPDDDDRPCHVGLVFVPTRESWQVPAFMGFGGVNFCPTPHKQVAILSKWQQGYGAEIVYMTRKTLEFYVKNPPATLEASLKLAQEQFAYCSDIDATAEELTKHLLNNHVWSFWWD